MKHTALVPKTFDVDLLEIRVPVCQSYIDDGDIDANCPFLEDNILRMWIKIDEGKVRDWPGGEQKIYLTVCDQGTYILWSGWDSVERIDCDYVPNKLIPGEFGDTISLEIEDDGTISNWYKKPSLEEFWPED
jgi:hypothetical protein